MSASVLLMPPKEFEFLQCLKDPSAFPAADVGLQNAVMQQQGLSKKPTGDDIRRDWDVKPKPPPRAHVVHPPVEESRQLKVHNFIHWCSYFYNF